MAWHKARKLQILEILEPYMVAKRDRTVIGHYERIEPGPDGRVRTEPNPIGTSTGRFSSSESPLDPYSTNLQNLNKKVAQIDPVYAIRDCIIPDPGYVLWAADYAGAEALLAAAYQQDWEMYQMLLDGKDVHTWHASIFFDMPEEQVGKGTIYRQIAKNIGYGGQYKASIWKLTETINREAEHTGVRVTQAQVETAYTRWLQLHPVEEWWENTRQELNTPPKNSLRNCFGFRRRFFAPDPEKRLKEGLAFYPQSTVASCIKRAMVRVDEELDDGQEIMQIMQIHDEIFGQVKENKVDKYMPEIVKILEEPFEIHGKEVWIPADASLGMSWGSMRAWQKAA